MKLGVFFIPPAPLFQRTSKKGGLIFLSLFCAFGGWAHNVRTNQSGKVLVLLCKMSMPSGAMVSSFCITMNDLGCRHCRPFPKACGVKGQSPKSPSAEGEISFSFLKRRRGWIPLPSKGRGKTLVGNVIKLRKEPHSEMNVALLFCKKSLRNFQKRLDKKAKVCGRFY